MPGPVELTQGLVTLGPMRPAQVLNRILRGEVANVDFVDLVKLVLALGFEEVGGRGSHRAFARAGVKELVNLQAERGQAKPYQVRQIAMVVRRYHLRLEDER
jgi:predicted RNA binding protein YcfA (HicA-like mRNA interferase family)